MPTRVPGPDDVDVTDSSGFTSQVRVLLAASLAVLTAAVVTLVVRTGDPSTADSYVSAVRNAALTLSDGTQVTAVDGMRVPNGATVRTGVGGAATVTTAGREVLLGAKTTLVVVDGLRERLDRGQLIVDSRGAPRLALTTRAGLADVPEDALVRVENGPVLRLGVFTGGASLTAAGRQATTKVPALYQLKVPYGGFAGDPRPLTLTDDAWEQQLAAELVNADRDLNALARGLRGTAGVTVLEAAPVALRRVPATTRDRGERALSVAVAQASRRSGGLADTLGFVQTSRDEGGSWGVVAALVQARVTAVSALLDTVLAPPGTTPPPVLAGPTPGLPGLLSPSPSPGGPSSTRSTGASPTPSRSKSPSPRPSGASPTTDPLGDLVTAVTDLLSPTTTPTPLIHLGSLSVG